MKGITKFMTAAVALATFASCADDLNLSTNQINGNGADLTATLESFDDDITRLAAVDNKGIQGVQSIVWTKNEKVRVFTLDQLSYDIYEIESGWNTVNATFKQTVNNNLTGQKYAMTEADMIYGISAQQDPDDGNKIKPLLTLTLPREWTPGEVDGNQKFPIPYWGPATVGENGELSAGLNGLTAFLRVNLKKLPTGTKYLVLTTHGTKSKYAPVEKNDGFMLAPFEKGKTLNFSTDVDAINSVELPWWYEKDANGEYKNAEWITDGDGEALTGTLNAFLEKGAELAVDERLVHSDELIVNISNLTQTIAYIPILCGEYENLHVIAASYVSKGLKYCYAGQELRVFQNQEFMRNKAYYLDMSYINLGDACIGEVNQAIYQTAQNQCASYGEAGMTTLITVDKLYKNANPLHTGTNHNDRYIDVSNVKGNIILDIKEIGLNDNYGTQKGNPLLITDNVSNSSAPEKFTNTRSGLVYNSFVKVILPEADGWDSDGNGQVDRTADKNYVKFNLGKHDLILSNQEGRKTENVFVDWFGSSTKLGNNAPGHTYDILGLQGPSTVIEEETASALTVFDGFQEVNVLKGTNGDVYVYTPRQAEEETEIGKLDIQTQAATGIRLDNALVENLKFSDGANAVDNRLVFTTGSSAIKDVLTFDDNKYETPATAQNTPTRVIMRSFWGNIYPDERGKYYGSALSARAIASGYDTKTIYTVAQLASVGEGIYAFNANGNNSNHETDLRSLDPQVSKYNIPIALVQTMWLGDNLYPWIGARVRVDNFEIDGENVELKNMKITNVNWFTYESYVDDPHWCCTSCWKPATKDHSDQLTQDLGLIRSIINTSTAKVENINLNDVWCAPGTSIDNVGSVVGRIQVKDQCDILHNHVGEVKITNSGKYNGGMVGKITLDGALTVWNNEVAGLRNKSGMIQGGDYVGGIVGGVDKAAATVFDQNSVQLGSKMRKPQDVNDTDNLEGNAYEIKGVSYVGGIVGNLNSTSTVDFDKSHVYIYDQILGSGQNVGGVAGKVTSKDESIFNENIVKIFDIQIKGSNNVGGLVGWFLNETDGDTYFDLNMVESPNILGTNYVGGLGGLLKSLNNTVRVRDIVEASQNDNQVAPMVKVHKVLQASNQYAGGLFGRTILSVGEILSVASAQVEVDENLEATQGFAGGFIGQMEQGQTYIGVSTWKSAKWNRYNKVDVAKMSGRYAVGGVIGNNSQSQKTPVNVYTGYSDYEYEIEPGVWVPFTTALNIDVDAYAKTGTPIPDTENYKWGTFSNLIGLMNDDLFINKDYSTEGPDYLLLFVDDALNYKMKEELGYKNHYDNKHNVQDGQFYWGDQNGYVGWRGNGKYMIGTKESSLGEQLDPDRLPGHNCYYQDGSESQYNYYVNKSKWEGYTF